MKPPLKAVLERRRRMRMRDHDRFHLVTVESSWYPMEAWIIRNRLMLSGISAYLDGDLFVTWFWHYANAVGGVKVQVAARDAARAHALLETLKSQSTDPRRDQSSYEDELSDTVADEEGDICQACGSHEMATEHYSRRAAFFGALLVGFPLPIRKYVKRCFACGVRRAMPTRPWSESQVRTTTVLVILSCVIFALMAWIRMRYAGEVYPSGITYY